MKIFVYLPLSILILVACGKVPNSLNEDGGTKFEYQSVDLKKSMPSGTVSGKFSIEEYGSKVKYGVARVSVNGGSFIEEYKLNNQSTTTMNHFKHKSDYMYEWINSDQVSIGLCKCNIALCNCEASFGHYKFSRTMMFSKTGFTLISTTSYLNKRTTIKADLNLAVENPTP